MDPFPAGASCAPPAARLQPSTTVPTGVSVAFNAPQPRDHGAGRPDGSRDRSAGAPGDFTRPEEDQPGSAKSDRRERFGGRTEDFVDTVESAIHRTVPRKVRAGRNPRDNTVINVIWRAAVLVVGLTLIGIGVALLVLPGPGWGAILLGLVVLASEYTWANRLLQPVRRRVRAEAARLRSRSRGQQIALVTTTVVFALVLAGFGIWYYRTYGLALPW